MSGLGEELPRRHYRRPRIGGNEIVVAATTEEVPGKEPYRAARGEAVGRALGAQGPPEPVHVASEPAHAYARLVAVARRDLPSRRPRVQRPREVDPSPHRD